MVANLALWISSAVFHPLKPTSFLMELVAPWRWKNLPRFLWGRSLVVCFLLTGEEKRKKHKKQGLHWRPHVPLNIFGGTLGAKKLTDEVNVSCNHTSKTH